MPSTNDRFSPVYPDLVEKLRQRAMQKADEIELLTFLCRELGEGIINLDHSVKLGPGNTESGMRLAIIIYLEKAFGILAIERALSTLSGALWGFSVEGSSLVESFPGALEPISEMIEQNRDKWAQTSR